MKVDLDIDTLIDTKGYQKFMEERAKERAEKRAQSPYGEVDNSIDWFDIDLVGILEDLEQMDRRIAKITPHMIKNLMLKRYYDRSIRIPRQFLKVISEIQTLKKGKMSLEKDITFQERLVDTLEELQYVCETLNEIFLNDRIKKLISKIKKQDYSELLYKDNLKYLENKAHEFIKLFQSIPISKELLEIAEKRIHMNKMPNTATIMFVFRKWSRIDSFNTNKKVSKGHTGFIVPVTNPYIPEGEWRLGNEIDLLHYKELMDKFPEITMNVSQEVEDTQMTLFNFNENVTYSLNYAEGDR